MVRVQPNPFTAQGGQATEDITTGSLRYMWTKPSWHISMWVEASPEQTYLRVIEQPVVKSPQARREQRSRGSDPNRGFANWSPAITNQYPQSTISIQSSSILSPSQPKTTNIRIEAQNDAKRNFFFTIMVPNPLSTSFLNHTPWHTTSKQPY